MSLPREDKPPDIPPKRSSSTGSNGHATQMANDRPSSADLLKIFKEAEKFNFYHGKLEGKKVEKILRGHLDAKGSYLLRKSNSNQDALTFSVVHTANHIYHFNVLWMKEQFAVTDTLVFSSIEKLISHFERNEIPGDKNPGLYLKYPIPIKKKQPSTGSNNGAAGGLNSPKTIHKTSSSSSTSSVSPSHSPKPTRSTGRPTPPSSPLVFRKKSVELNKNRFSFERKQNSAAAVPTRDPLNDRIPAPSPSREHNNKSPVPSRDSGGRRLDPGDRPPMPIPREPIYDSRQHHYDLYATAEDPDRDRFYQIKALCQKVDDEIAKQSKKCTCGLYLYQSTLVDDWMMHRDIEETATKGKIFFVNTVSNEATWQLPNHIRKKMEAKEPDKWRIINAVLQSENSR